MKKEIIATNMKGMLKWLFQPVHGSSCPAAKYFPIFLMHTRSSWTPFLLLHQWWVLITWAFAELLSQRLCLNSWDNVRLSKRVLQENQMTDAGKIMKVTFEQLLPRPGHDYIFDPTIKKFLGETFLDPLAINKGKRENYRGMSSNNLKLD